MNEEQLARAKCLAKISTILDMFEAYHRANGALFYDLKQLSDFVMETQGIDLASFNEMLFNGRDGKSFHISFGPKGVTVREAIGVDDERLVISESDRSSD